VQRHAIAIGTGFDAFAKRFGAASVPDGLTASDLNFKIITDENSDSTFLDCTYSNGNHPSSNLVF
jgi:hypothetical protein